MTNPNSFSASFLSMYQKLTPQSTPDSGMHVEVDSPVDRYIGTGNEPFWYSVRINTPCTEELLTSTVFREIQIARQKGRSTFEWKTYAIPMFSKERLLKELLIKNGFELNRTSRLMYHSADIHLAAPGTVNIKAVRSAEDFKLLLEINETAFGVRAEWLNSGLKNEVLNNSGSVRAYLAFVDGQLAAGGWIKLYGPIGFLFGSGTHPSLRKRGAYRALVSARCKFAKENGILFVASECSPDSEKILKTLTFEDAGEALQWVWKG